MADICIIYAREDHEKAEKLHELLSQQWTTWWDEDIVGDFAEEIEAEIPKARCIIPLFTVNSRKKGTVTDELRLAMEHNIKLLPIKLDESRAPYGYGNISSIDMRDWTGEVDHSGFKLLQRKISNVVPAREKPQRPKAIAHGKVPLPTIFMSVSSFNTNVDPPDAVRILLALKMPTILVSAYDLAWAYNAASRQDEDRRDAALAMVKELEKYQKEGLILIDSGKYESSKLKDKSWVENNLKEALSCTPHHWAFCFDNMDPSKGHRLAVEEIVKAVKRDQKFTSKTILPIIHAPKLKKGGFQLEKIPQIIREVSEILEPPLIAIPERELGAGLIARAKTVREIRKELDKLPYYQPIHLLGTGNPWSIAVLAAAGADTFDGLEWCRYTLDTELEGINHFQLFDLFDDVDTEMGFGNSVTLHNLKYFTSFGNIMHDMFTQNKIESFVQGVLSKNAFQKLKEQFPELFE